MDFPIIALALLRFGGVALTLGALTALLILIGFNLSVEEAIEEVPHSWLFSAGLLALFGIVVICATM